MHSAPSVSYPVGRCRFAAGLAGAVWLLGCGTTLVWALLVQAPSWRQAAAALLVLEGGLVALIGWLRAPAGHLIWQGSWTWRAHEREMVGRVRIIMDLQRYVLVRWNSETGDGLWFWLDRGLDPAQWGALRRALYSRAKIEVSPGLLPTASES